MSDVKHTTGPWVYDPDTATVDVAGTHVVVAGINDHDGIGWDEGEANARLITAAPEMLALLKTLHADLADYSKRTEEVWSSASIALGSMADDCARLVAKAEGRDQ